LGSLLTSDGKVWSLKDAQAYCRQLAVSHYENFTVGSWLLPRAKRQHVYNLYSYARSVDDLGDEAQGDRLQLLDRWEEELDLCYIGVPRNPVMVALKETIHQFQIPREPFSKLIQANRIDQATKRYRTFQDLLHYCDHSANPCGRLFLYIFDYRDGERHQLSDYTCTALQLANFWQDVPRDHQMGRIYLPLEDMERFGYTEEELERGEATEAFQNLMAFEVDRTRIMFRQGLELVDRVEGAARLDITLFSRGGLAILDAIETQGYNVLSQRPRLSRIRKGWLFLSTWTSIRLGRRPRA
jgi:squalene synthase HpnC